MKLFSSDEVGLIKLINLNTPSSSSSSSTTVFGTVNRNKSIHAITAHNATITVAREDGSIDVIGTNGTQLQHYQCSFNASSKLKWIGIYYYNNFIYGLTDTGKGVIIDTTLESTDNKCQTQFDLLQNELFSFKLHESGRIATGGRDRDLHVWDIHSLMTDSPLILYKAKNVKNCELDLKQNVWLRDIQFITATKLVVATEYMFIRVYDTALSKRPYINIKVGSHPFRSLATTQDYCVVGDNIGQVMKFGYEAKKMIGKFQGCAGSVVGLICERQKVITVGMDRFLRVFGKDRQEEEKVYLKQRLTGVCLVRDENEDGEESDEHEDIWDAIQVENDSDDSLE